MTICIPTIMYKRWATFKVFEQGIRELQQAYSDIEFKVLVVGTDDSLIIPEDFIYFGYPNEPLSRKAQYRLEMAEHIKADYYLFLGSDDIVSPLTFEHYLNCISQGCKWIAPLDLYAWKDGQVYYSAGYGSGNPRQGESLAVGRMLSRDVLDRVGWTLWPEFKYRNIDRMAYDRLNKLNIRKNFFGLNQVNGFICDIKTSENVSRWHSGWKLQGDQSHYFSREMQNLLNEI